MPQNYKHIYIKRKIKFNSTGLNLAPITVLPNTNHTHNHIMLIRVKGADVNSVIGKRI